jgi:hypothetical protein
MMNEQSTAAATGSVGPTAPLTLTCAWVQAGRDGMPCKFDSYECCDSACYRRWPAGQAAKHQQPHIELLHMTVTSHVLGLAVSSAQSCKLLRDCYRNRRSPSRATNSNDAPQVG